MWPSPGVSLFNIVLLGVQHSLQAFLSLQIWYIIPLDREAAFLQRLRETIPNGAGLSYVK